MEIIHTTVAGTVESSDIQITIEPAESGVTVDLSSIVMNQYGRQIKKVILQTLKDLGVENANLVAVDRGALDCTIKARVECAVYRASDFSGQIPWGGVQ